MDPTSTLLKIYGLWLKSRSIPGNQPVELVQRSAVKFPVTILLGSCWLILKSLSFQLCLLREVYPINCGLWCLLFKPAFKSAINSNLHIQFLILKCIFIPPLPLFLLYFTLPAWSWSFATLRRSATVTKPKKHRSLSSTVMRLIFNDCSGLEKRMCF